MLLASLSSFKKQTHNLAASTPEHPTNSNSRDGLIILLHGAPGTGKSMTAQCLANYVGRPLLPLSPGRIGVTALEIQAGLTEVFQLANQWGCIVLMDDADVYVEQRSLSDMQRNSVVTGTC
jgi:SpoVK/Ycf46/Vps4 family AAA+-type ATPase